MVEEIIDFIESDFSSKETFYLYRSLYDLVDSMDEMGMSRKSFSSFRNQKLNKEGILLDKNEFLNILKKNHIFFLNVELLPVKFYICIDKSPIVHFRKWLITISNTNLVKSKGDIFNNKYFITRLKGGKFIFSKITENISHESCLYSIYFSVIGFNKNVSFRFFYNKKKSPFIVIIKMIDW